MRVQFFGAVDTVTGSSTLVEGGRTRVLVDCGMFQGVKAVRSRNWDPREVGELDAVVLTHAHLDHSGWLPRLVRQGFSGPILCTPATADLLSVLLLDAAHLQEEDAARANRRQYTRHAPALPLYTTEDVEKTVAQVVALPWDETLQVGEIDVLLREAGHMLGASSVRLTHEGRAAVFSGDIGRDNDVLLRAPAPFEGADLLVVESTYGDRLHEPGDPKTQLGEVVRKVMDRGGVLMIPAFAVGRSQAILHLLATLRADGDIPSVPTFLNSPMAITASEIFCEHLSAHKLSADACQAFEEGTTYVRTVEESKELNRRKGPMIVIAGAGMLNGGRILHHLEAFARDRRNAILFVGFQAPGTRGAALLDGVKSLRIHGRDVPIRAGRFRIDALSGHADGNGIVGWLGNAPQPRTVLINHGEPTSADAMRLRLKDALGWEANAAREGRWYEV